MIARRSSETLAKAGSITAQIEVWKKIVDVQQHFNDIGWRIRALAMTALTFTLGATFFGYLNAEPVTVGSLHVNPAAFVPVLGFFIWLLFWFADGIWYHRLLTGAGAAAGLVEQHLRSLGVTAELSTEIQKASHRTWMGVTMNSARKLNIFYMIGALILIIAAVALLVMTGSWGSTPSIPSPVVSVSPTP